MAAGTIIMATAMTESAPLAPDWRLWQLISPTLPVGAYAYSGGLELAIERGWVADEAGALDWIEGLLRHSLAMLDVPILLRCHEACRQGDAGALCDWNDWLLAARESAELQQEDLHLGRALLRLLDELAPAARQAWPASDPPSYVTAFALATAHWNIGARQAAQGYLWAWCENQVAAAVKLVPLGQTAGQRMLAQLGPGIEAAVQRGQACEDRDIGYATPGLAMASAWHERQYTRLFRS